SRQYGLPRTNPDRYALRTPSTFAAVIDVPVLLVQTANASDGRKQQLDQLTAYLDESDVVWERMDAPDEPIAQTLQRVSQHLETLFADVPASTIEEPEGATMSDEV
ncbi:MAG: hypothetical protein WKF81_10825, partial [Thermomicrobiales bacterium]